MKKTQIGGTKRKVTNILAMLGLIIIFIEIGRAHV